MHVFLSLCGVCIFDEMKWIFLIFYITHRINEATKFDFDYESPDINDIFILEDEHNETKDEIPGVFIKNITVDIAKLNITKFWKKLEGYKGKLKEKYPELRFDSFDQLTDMKNFNDTRRQVLKWTWYKTAEYREASLHMTKLKALDLMLQLIYMAKHKLKQLENSKYFQRTDTGYRIAYIYRRLRRIYTKMMDLYSTMHKHRHVWEYPDWHLQLHTKATKLHVDFLYLWWVLVRVDEKYKIRHGNKPKIPAWRSLPKPTTRRP